jgi:type I restriction enzyme S subunit
VEFDFGLPFSSDYFNSLGLGLPLLRIRDLRTFDPRVSTTQRLKRDVLVEPGDVVAGMDGEFRPCFWLGRPALLNQRVLRGRPRGFGGSAFVREVLAAPLREFEQHKTGTTVVHLNGRDLSRTIVTVPAVAALRMFDRAAEPLTRELVGAAQQAALLRQLRDALLLGMLSGKIHVQDAVKPVEEAT